MLPAALPGAGRVIVMGLENVALAAPTICTSIARLSDVTDVKPPVIGSGIPETPDLAVVVSAGAAKLNDGSAVRMILLPAASLAVMVVLVGMATVTAATAKDEPAGAETVWADVVVTVPVGFTVPEMGALVVLTVAGAGELSLPQPPA